MNAVSNYIDKIRKLIAQDKLGEVFELLQELFKNSPELAEIIQQSARFSAIQEQVRLGIVSQENAEITQNQIRWGLLQWLQEMNKQHHGKTWSNFVEMLDAETQKPTVKAKMEAAISIQNSTNVIAGNDIQAGRDVIINFGKTETDNKTEAHHYNIGLTKAIVNGMAQYSKKATQLQRTKGWDTQADNLKKVQAFLCRSFVGEIGKQLRQLIAIGNETEMPEEKKQTSFVCKCLDIAKRSLDLVNFALLSELWDAFRIAPRTLTDLEKEKLRHRFDHTLEFSLVEQFELLGTLYKIFGNNNLTLPLEELANFSKELTNDSALHRVCQAFDALSGRASASFSAADCAESEQELANFFQYFSFLTNYKMASIKRIGYRQDRNTDPRFLHRYIALGIDQKATEDAEKVNFTDLGEATYAVLLYRGDHYQDAKSISLFPFVIDYNALTFEKGAKVCFFSSKDFTDGILEYRFLTDNSLIKVEKEDILSKIADVNELMLEDKNRTVLNLDMVTDGFRDARKTILGDEETLDFDNL